MLTDLKINKLFFKLMQRTTAAKYD